MAKHFLESPGYARSPKARDEGWRIGLALSNTLRFNSSIRELNILNYMPEWIRRILGSNQRAKGYYCWEWAYAFRDAFDLEKPTCFKATVENSYVNDGSGRVHAWLRIESLETKNVIYVDDGFFDGTYVHLEKPVGGGYIEDITNRVKMLYNPKTGPRPYDSKGVRH